MRPRTRDWSPGCSFCAHSSVVSSRANPIVASTAGSPHRWMAPEARSQSMSTVPLASAARAYAALQGRDFVIPDDIKFLGLPVLRHRVTLSPGAEIEGLATDRILAEIFDQTPAPR